MRNKIYFLLLILTPLVSYSQIGISIAGSSHFTAGQTILPLQNGTFETAKYEVRNNSISLDWNTGRRLIIGEIWCVLGITYNIIKTDYDFPETNLINYELIERRLVPSIALQYVLVSTGSLRIYSSIGTYTIFENLNLEEESNLDLDLIDNYAYNGIIPFMRTGAQLNLGKFTINPFVGYEFETIYFDKFSDISKSDFEKSLENAGIRTGLRFGILF